MRRPTQEEIHTAYWVLEYLRDADTMLDEKQKKVCDKAHTVMMEYEEERK